MGEEKEYKLIRVEEHVATKLELMRVSQKERSMNSLLDNITRTWYFEKGCRPVQSAIDYLFGIRDDKDDDNKSFSAFYVELQNRGLDIMIELGSYEKEGDVPKIIICYDDDIISNVSTLPDQVLTRNYIDYPTHKFTFGHLSRESIMLTDNIKVKDLDFIKSFEVK